MADLMIFDSDSTVGGVWSRDRVYPNLVAQVKVGVGLMLTTGRVNAEGCCSYSTTLTRPCNRMEEIPRMNELLAT